MVTIFALLNKKHAKCGCRHLEILECVQLSQNLNIGFYLNFPDSKMGTKVAYCAGSGEKYARQSIN